MPPEPALAASPPPGRSAGSWARNSHQHSSVLQNPPRQPICPFPGPGCCWGGRSPAGSSGSPRRWGCHPGGSIERRFREASGGGVCRGSPWCPLRRGASLPAGRGEEPSPERLSGQRRGTGGSSLPHFEAGRGRSAPLCVAGDPWLKRLPAPGPFPTSDNRSPQPSVTLERSKSRKGINHRFTRYSSVLGGARRSREGTGGHSVSDSNRVCCELEDSPSPAGEVCTHAMWCL